MEENATKPLQRLRLGPLQGSASGFFQKSPEAEFLKNSATTVMRGQAAKKKAAAPGRRTGQPPSTIGPGRRSGLSFAVGRHAPGKGSGDPREEDGAAAGSFGPGRRTDRRVWLGHAGPGKDGGNPREEEGAATGYDQPGEEVGPFVAVRASSGPSVRNGGPRETKPPPCNHPGRRGDREICQFTRLP